MLNFCLVMRLCLLSLLRVFLPCYVNVVNCIKRLLKSSKKFDGTAKIAQMSAVLAEDLDEVLSSHTGQVAVTCD